MWASSRLNLGGIKQPGTATQPEQKESKLSIARTKLGGFYKSHKKAVIGTGTALLIAGVAATLLAVIPHAWQNMETLSQHAWTHVKGFVTGPAKDLITGHPYAAAGIGAGALGLGGIAFGAKKGYDHYKANAKKPEKQEPNTQTEKTNQIDTNDFEGESDSDSDN